MKHKRFGQSRYISVYHQLCRESKTVMLACLFVLFFTSVFALIWIQWPNAKLLLFSQRKIYWALYLVEILIYILKRLAHILHVPSAWYRWSVHYKWFSMSRPFFGFFAFISFQRRVGNWVRMEIPHRIAQLNEHTKAFKIDLFAKLICDDRSKECIEIDSKWTKNYF